MRLKEGNSLFKDKLNITVIPVGGAIKENA